MAKTITSHKRYKGVIVSKTDMRKLREGLNMKMKGISDLIIKQLSYIGEQAVKTARDNGKYNDITGNLRSSIGYMVLYDGKPVVYGASKQYSGKEGNGEQGAPAAEALLNKLQAKFPWGIVLIICAGMNYAAYVEFKKDKDVLHSAEQITEKLLDELLKGVVSGT